MADEQVIIPSEKSVFLSKTLWLNVIMALVAFYPPASEWMQGHMEIVLAVFGGLNMVLRLISKDKLYLY